MQLVVGQYEKAKVGNSELGDTSVEIGNANLRKSMLNKKLEVQRITDQVSYLKWRKYMEESAFSFKSMFSKKANELFDYYFRMNRVFEETLVKLSNETTVIIGNL